MTKYVNVYPGSLILPSGSEIARDAEVDLSKADLENAGVNEWLDAGWLVKPGNIVKVSKDADPAVQAALDQALADLAARDATIADRDATIAKLTADLEAATKPADPVQ